MRAPARGSLHAAREPCEVSFIESKQKLLSSGFAGGIGKPQSGPQSGQSLSRMCREDGEEPGLGDSRPFTKGVARSKGSARGHGSNLPIAKWFRWREKLSADDWDPRHERVFFSSPLPAI